MIDKSIRQHYDNKYSAKNRKGLDEGGWGGDESWGEPSDNGGNDDGGWSPSVSYSPPAPTPSPHRDTAADLMAEATRMENERKAIEAEIEAEQHEAERSNQLAEARRLMTQPTDVQMPDVRTPISLGQIDPYQQSYILPNEILTDPWSTYDVQKEKKEIEDARRIDVGFQEALRKQKIATDLRQKQQDPDYGQFFRPQPVVETPKTGIGGALKTMGKGVLEAALMPFLPKPVRTAWTTYKRGKQAAAFAKRLGIDMPTAFKFTKPDTQTQATKKLVNGDGGENFAQQVASGEDVVTETTKKYTGAKEEGQTELRKRLNIIQGILDEGSYQGQELTGKQRNSLLDYIKRINEYLVPVTQGAAHGGSVDKALTGRSRDI